MRWSERTEPGTAASGGSLDVPTASAVASWLADIDADGPTARPDRLTNILEMLRRSALPANQRFRSIEHCSQAASHMKRDLDQSLAGLMLPLPADKERLSRKCAQTYWLLAECYKKVAEEFIARDNADLRDATYLLRACYWGIANLGECLLINYERYLKVRKGIWLDVHRLYNIALAEGIQNVEIKAGGSRPTQTIEHVYKRVLLLGLSDPFHHPFRGLSQIYTRLDNWAQLASLTTTSPDSGRCLFTVDPTLDRPAMPALSQSRIRPEFSEKWLNTRNLVDKLKKQHERAIRMALLRLEQPEGVTEELDSIELLRRLIVNWGIHPIRNASRSRTSKNCEVVIGLKSVCSALNDFEPLTQDKPGPSSEWINMLKASLIDKPSSHDRGSELINHWDIEDESEYGWRLAAGEDIAAGRVTIGELVAVRTGEHSAWNIGSVRWAQTDDDNRLSLGIRKTTDPARPVLICRLQTDEPANPVTPALLLVHRSDDGHGFSLVCDKGMYLPTGTYLVQLLGSRGERVLEATNIKLSTRSFVWFDARKPQASTTQRTLDLIYPH